MKSNILFRLFKRFSKKKIPFAVTTHELPRLILEEGYVPMPIYHGKGYVRGETEIKF